MFILLCAILFVQGGQVIATGSEKCLTPNKQQGSCISLYSCPKLIDLLTKKQEDSEEFVRKSRCGTTPTEPLVCCPLEIETPGTCLTPNKKEGKCTSLSACPELLKLVATQRYDSIDYVRKSTCQVTALDAFVCCPLESPKNKTQVITRAQDDFLIASRRYCGYQHSDDYDNKSPGATISEFPWLAGLNYLKRTGKEEISCQGTIINARYILTAAHCLFLRQASGITLKSIRLGEYSLRNSTDCVEDTSYTECSDPVQEYDIEEQIIHPKFTNGVATEYDIGLVRLNKTIQTYSDYVRPICLPLPGSRSAQIGDRLITTGWGKTSTGTTADIKKKILNELITNAKCQELFKANNGVRLNLTDNVMCTKELSDNIEFSCAGDSGGPVMFSYRSQWYVEGINSFGSRLCGNKYPVVHTRVSKYIDWIRDNMRPW